MNLQQQIKKDLTSAMKAKDEERKNAIRIIMGEMGRLDQKDFSDDDVIKIVKKLIKSEKETLERSGVSSSDYLKIMESYLPAMASGEEIRSWIEENIDFSQFKNKMMAMGTIMKHFGAAADGNTVKKILQEF